MFLLSPSELAGSYAALNNQSLSFSPGITLCHQQAMSPACSPFFQIVYHYAAPLRCHW